MLPWIMGFCILSSLGSLLCATLLLLVPDGLRQILVPRLVSFATGTLLGGAFLSLIPAGLATLGARPFMVAVLAGIVLFFLLEKLVLWHHCSTGRAPARKVSGPLILVGDAFHNFVDGVVIAAAFMTSLPLGLTVSVAVLAHEIPQELGDFAILLDNGFSRPRALAFNGVSALTALLGSVLAYFWFSGTQGIVPYMLAISAASFIYIATVDLIPSLHEQMRLSASLQQLALLVAGVGVIASLQVG